MTGTDYVMNTAYNVLGIVSSVLGLATAGFGWMTACGAARMKAGRQMGQFADYADSVDYHKGLPVSMLADLVHQNRKKMLYNRHRITEEHPDYEAVKNMFGKKRREIEAKAEAEAGTPPEFVPLDAVLAAFEAAETVTALKDAATRLGIPENHPDSEAIYAAYRERQRKIEAQDKERAA